ncbi:glycogen debranching N-terminal domain-containing protein [Haloarcula sp. JP-L23]|uniref:amylo-alpha-1,6-glucosidase n=1 Tax=Haloarcula sp. JP-L23 TaxID=2716717 RepID=UPI00140EBD4E|nr:hypothetical protein G9465_02965 [Haloarcula sp. JP-L23]
MAQETLVDGYTYLVFPTADHTDITAGDTGGLYDRDTRYLSRLSCGVATGTLTRLQSTLVSPRSRTETLAPATTEVNAMTGTGEVPKHTDRSFTRRLSVTEGHGAVQTVTVRNHSPEPQSVELRLGFEADFADLFEVRGFEADIDRTVETRVSDDTVRKAYSFAHGDADTAYSTTIAFDPVPSGLSDDEARFSLTVKPRDTTTVTTRIGLDDTLPPAETLATDTDRVDIPAVPTADDEVAGVVEQAAADLRALTTDTEYGYVPLAGTPWFVAPFGRDSLITAYQALPVAPKLATGTLRYLAAHQGQRDDEGREEEPGKIFHEQRHGELAARGIVPHTPYYGTIDATPLWVLLLAETCDWRGSPALATELAGSLRAALDWIYDTSTSGPDDPFLYYTTADTGLAHRGWKDTTASVRFADGSTADGPLALAEVQGYAAAALRRGSSLLAQVARREVTPDVSMDRCADYREQATAIECTFDDQFWLPDRSFYGLAKTGEGDIVDAVTSNVGHCLWTGLVPESRDETVVQTLQRPELADGWGVRTMSATDAGYSPVSYHAGGVWPHDTSLIAIGLSRYGYGDVAEQIGRHVLDAGASTRHERLPELYCGFDRETEPTPYPATCVPQAWGAGAPFALLRAAFGLQPTDDGTIVSTRSSSLFPERALDHVRDCWGEIERQR